MGTPLAVLIAGTFIDGSLKAYLFSNRTRCFLDDMNLMPKGNYLQEGFLVNLSLFSDVYLREVDPPGVTSTRRGV